MEPKRPTAATAFPKPHLPKRCATARYRSPHPPRRSESWNDLADLLGEEWREEGRKDGEELAAAAAADTVKMANEARVEMRGLQSALATLLATAPGSYGSTSGANDGGGGSGTLDCFGPLEIAHLSWALGTLLAHGIYGTWPAADPLVAEPHVTGAATTAHSAATSATVSVTASAADLDPLSSTATSLNPLVQRTLAVVPAMASSNDWQGLAHVNFMVDMIQKVRRAHTAPHRTAPHRTALHRTAPHCTALHRTALHTAAQRTALRRTTKPRQSKPL